jgi:hypothetical protein
VLLLPVVVAVLVPTLVLVGLVLVVVVPPPPPPHALTTTVPIAMAIVALRIISPFTSLDCIFKTLNA